MFAWDENKAVLNLSKHGVSFEEAESVFDDPLFLTFPDPSHSEIETRFLIIGASNYGRLLMVSYSKRFGQIRIISARKATPKESRKYESECY